MARHKLDLHCCPLLCKSDCLKNGQEMGSSCAVNSVLAIGGVGGLAVGLAGREILENLFTGLIILSSSPFEVGDEVLFSPPSGQVQLFGLLRCP